MSESFVWTPPGAGPAELENFLALRNGLPANANESIHRWLCANESETRVIDWTFMLQFQQAARVDLGILAVKWVQVSDAFRVLRTFSEIHRTWLVDFVLSGIGVWNSRSAEPARVTQLRRILRDCGSSWTVGVLQDRLRLVEVLPSAVLDVVESTLSAADKSSDLLRSAWDAAFGVNPRPSHAYFDAVRSVEVLSCPLISPKDGNATLGKDINVLRNSPHAWRFVMSGSARTSSVEQVVHMMQLLWHSQTDRHGRADYEDVSIAESQAAVLLASTLVGWLSKGMLARATT